MLNKFAQDIVNRAMKTLGYNINIMDNMGIIIASGDKKRLNTFHEAAETVIRTGKPVEITLEDAEKLQGVKPGVNLPITINDKIVGVVGITGNPAEISGYGKLIKITVESMYEQCLLTEQLNIDEKVKEMFIIDLISGNTFDRESLLQRSSVLNIDLKVPRIPIIVKIYSKHATGIKIVLNECELNPNYISLNMGSNNILILIPLLRGNEIKDIKEETFALLKNLKEKLQKEEINYNIAVGNYYPELEGIKTSYREILETFAIIEKSKIRNKVYFTFDKNLEILINNVREELIENYKYHFLNNEETVKLFQDKKMLDTLNAFFDSNFNSTISSRELNITRNTLNNRLNKVERVTGYDPRVFNDAIKLKVLLIIDEIRD